jgi:hypothetical protein
MASIAQLVRACGCQPQGREFEPPWERFGVSAISNDVRCQSSIATREFKNADFVFGWYVVKNSCVWMMVLQTQRMHWWIVLSLCMPACGRELMNVSVSVAQKIWKWNAETSNDGGIPWNNICPGVGLLIRRLRVWVPQGVHFVLKVFYPIAEYVCIIRVGKGYIKFFMAMLSLITCMNSFLRRRIFYKIRCCQPRPAVVFMAPACWMTTCMKW